MKGILKPLLKQIKGDLSMKGKKGYQIAVFILCLLLLVACSNTQTGNPSAEIQGENGKPEFVFKTSIQTPRVAPMAKGFDAYLDAIEEKSGGRIRFERYYSESLTKSSDALEAVGSGIADVAVIIPVYMVSKLPLNTIAYNPAIFENSWAGARALHDLYQNVSALNQELESHKVKFVGQLSVPSNYIFTRKPVHRIEDLKGMKLIAPGDHGVIAQELGAVPVGLTSTESFEAIQRGTVDGGIYNLALATTYNIEQAANYIYKLPIGGISLLLGMNLDKYNSLPPELQEIIKEVAVAHADDFHQIYQTEGDKASLEKIAKANGVITQAAPEDIEKLKGIAKEAIWKKWIEKSGPHAKETLDEYIRLAAKYEIENPFKKK